MKHGDLVVEHMGHAERMARSFLRRVELDIDDAIDAAYFGLVKAATRYDGRVPFWAFARLYVKAELVDMNRKQGGRERPAVFVTLESVEISENPESACIARATITRLVRRARLRPRGQQVIALLAAGYRPRDVQAELGMSRGHYQFQHFDAMSRLRAVIA
jgi:RNA polymerase sigma factor (sigma-70 family)